MTKAKLYINCLLLLTGWLTAGKLFAQSDVWIWRKTNKLIHTINGIDRYEIDTNLNAQLLSTLGTTANSFSGDPLNYVVDCDGNLDFIFADDSFKKHVINSNYAPLHNTAAISSLPNSLLFPIPNKSDSILFIYPYGVTSYGLYYSIIRKSANAGQGEYIAINQPISNNNHIAFNIVRHHDPGKFWLLELEAGSNALFAHLIDSSGIHIANSPIDTLPNTMGSDAIRISSSPSGKLLAISHTSNIGNNYGGTLYIIKFNNANATITDIILLSTGNPSNQVNGLYFSKLRFFSPNDRYLYTYTHSLGHNYFQWDLSVWDSSAIINSGIAIDTNGSKQYWSLGMQPMLNGDALILRKSYTGTFYFDRIRNIDSSFSRSNFDSAFYILPANPHEPTSSLGFLPLRPAYLYATDRYSIYSDSIGCLGTPHPFRLREEDGLQHLSWHFGDSTNGVPNTSNQWRPSHSYSSPGVYTVTAMATYCNFTDTMYFQLHILGPPASPALPDVQLCAGDSLLVDLPADTSLVYRWQDGDSSRSRHFSQAGLYWVDIDNGCFTLRDSFYLNLQYPPLRPLPADTAFCAGDSLVLTPQSGDYSWNWQNGDSLPLTVRSPGQYILLLHNSCGSFPFTVQVRQLNEPDFHLPADTTLCMGTPLQLQYNADSSWHFQWENGSTLPYRTFTDSGLYQLTVSNNCGSTTKSMQLALEDCSCKLWMPTAFSPNNDGLNDVFTPNTICKLNNYELRIYNRWGELLFVSQQTQNGWDGNVNGQPAPPGIYVYVVHYLRDTLGPRIDSGSFSLIR